MRSTFPVEEARHRPFSQVASAPRADRGLVQLFVYLQLLDFLTTLVGFKVGAAEASPFIRLLMHGGPALGVAASKLLALAIGGVCLYFGKQHILRWATYWYSALVIWNLTIILAAR